MKEFRNKTAVVTGAAGGIGLALAKRLAAEGMNVVMADIDLRTLDDAVKTVAENPGRIKAVPTDVSDAESVNRLAAAARDAFGAVHVLCANAGVASFGSVWEQSLDDWRWTLNVNLWGVIHSLRAFIPGMLAHGEEGHVVVTSSAAGLAPFTSAAYGASKYAILGIAEGLALELAQTPVGVTALCPGPVKTAIYEADRNRPPELGERGSYSEAVAKTLAGMKDPNRTDQLSPASVAEQVMNAIRSRELYILPTQETYRQMIRERMQRVLAALDPAPAPAKE